jgi:hypothetical protein
MPITTTFPVLAQATLAKHVDNVAAAFPDKSKKLAARLEEEIALRVAAAAMANTTPTLLASVPNGHGSTHAVKTRLGVFVIDEHWEGNKQCLKLFTPLHPSDFKLKKLESGGVAEVYDEKDWKKVDRIVIDILPSRVDVFLNSDRETSLEGTWSRALAESALAVLNRAKASAARAADGLDSSSGARGSRVNLVDALTARAPKTTSGPPLGTDLEGAVSWRGMPVVVTSDRDGAGPAHVMVERRDGTGVWWPIPVPDNAKFPSRGCSVMLDGDQLVLAGGFDVNGVQPTAVRFSVDLADAMKPGFTAAQWREKAELNDATAWAAAAVSDREQFVAGGVAGFYVGKNKRGADAKLPRSLSSTQIGGAFQFRNRSAPPQSTAGSFALVDKDAGCVFVGPGLDRDGKVCVFDGRESSWFALPTLPASVGLGQLFKRGDEIFYAGGFSADGKANKTIWSLNLKDPAASWTERGQSDAVAGKARAVERDGKLVSILVAPKGALVAHLE